MLQKASTSRLPEQLIGSVQQAHPEWQSVLMQGLERIAAAFPGYLEQLASSFYLPDGGRLFAAFARSPSSVRYVLIGEGPYPRPESATGVCFMDGAVDTLWSDNGLSKKVNRATSLRNFMKMLLVADGRLSAHATGGSEIAGLHRSDLVETLPALQQNMEARGFLLLNASLVWRPDVAPQIDARPWRLMLDNVLAALAPVPGGRAAPTLVLWGKIAGAVTALPIAADFPVQISEHPYNLSFIRNAAMQTLFSPMHLLQRA